MGFLIVLALTTPFRANPANPDAYWQLPVGILFFIVFTGIFVVPTTWAPLEVRDEGMFVRGRLAVRAEDMGVVELLGAWTAFGIYWQHRGRKIPARQNLYGGGLGWGKAVAVEDFATSARSTLWLLPGPRAEELAAALEAVRDAEAERHPGDDWSRRSVRRSGEDR